MFHPDPNGEHSVEEVIAKLTEVLVGVPHDSPRARKLAEMIGGLNEIAKERRTASAAPSAATD